MPQVVVLTILVSILIPNAIAYSSGDVTYCDAYGNFGCPENDWLKDSKYREDRLNCNNTKGAIMDWVAQAERSDQYSVRSGDREPSIDKTKYEPEKLMSIYVRALEYGWQFRGLLLYAVDSRGITVGSWEFPTTESSPYFWTPPNCKNKILHTTAARKPFRNVLHFRAPKAGTGSITFRCLIKKGPANHGFFYWPMQKDMVLDEDTNPPKTTWFKAGPGQSCKDACSQLNLPCDLNTMKSAGTLNGFSDGVAREFLCNTPAASSCVSYAPVMEDSGSCFYHAPSCESWRSNPGDLTCEATSSESESRLCVCGDGSKDPNNANNPNNPNNPDWKPPISSGTKIKPLNLLALHLLAGLVALFSGQKNNYFFFAAFILLLFVGSCDAHNWMHTPGRAYTRASTIKPCLGRKSSDTHAQITINNENPQMFTLQWATGHSRPSYFLVIHGDDSEKMGDPDLINIMKEYAADSPIQDGHTKDPLLQRYHGASTGSESDLSYINSQIGTDLMYKQKLDPNSALYADFHGNPGTRNRRNDNRGVKVWQTLLQYNTKYIENDARVSYHSNKYPWIEAVYKYEHLYHLASDFDGIMMTVDGRHGPGHYIVHWRWNGYYDCMDIDVREPTPALPAIPNIYGSWDGTSMVWNRVDHCQYIEPRDITTSCVQSPISADWCKIKTSTRTTTRYGINVVPLHNPKTVYSKFQSESTIPWRDDRCVSDWTKLEGKITESQFDYAGWTRKVDVKSGQLCTSAGEDQTMPFKQAVISCTTSIGCTGIAFKKASGDHHSADPLIFRICDDTVTEANSEWNTYMKKEIAPVPVQKASKTKVTFQPPMCEEPKIGRTGDRSCFDEVFEPPSDWLIDEGSLYSKKAGGSYGWNCTTFRDRRFNFRVADAQNPTLQNTYARNLYGSCHPYYTANSDHDPPYKYRHKNRSRWEIEVPNGVYKVRTNHTYNTKSDQRLGGCILENIRITDVNDWGPVKYFDTEVEILDGRLTFEGTFTGTTSFQFDCSGMSTLEMEMVYTRWTDSFMVGTTNAFWQLELSTFEAIGLVAITLPSFSTNCSSWWAFRGSKCRTEIPRGWFDQDLANTGMVVGVSNKTDRAGKVCGRVDFADDDVRVDCKGIIGKYVYIRLPGQDRAISFKSVSVHKAVPVSEPGDYVCYGVEPRVQTATSPEYRVVHDPEDPIFYSTCYVREKNVTWLDIDVATPKAPWHYNGQCIGCENYDRNLNLDGDKLHTIRWEVSEECVDCDTEQVPAPTSNPQEWVLAYSNRYCETAKHDCPSNTCWKKLTLIGRNSYEIMDTEECKLVASRDDECSNHVMWRPSRRECSCYKSKTCCRGCTPRTSTSDGYYIYELVSSSPVENCVEAGFVLSDDKTMCCPASCSVEDTNYCGTTNTDCSRKVQFGGCCKIGLQKNCTDHAAPCLM